ncbi:substrate-binding domain-containing protein [Antribacter gilvus]|uniref:substrate-binding domain-containing protein n=1 Tax=Antribacter gilvus TaxID=2304675 RepID=UPI000F77CA9C|nr:substrate-binding domain-containing protein [Antribacter gilvus]
MASGKRRYTVGVLSPVVGGHYFGRMLAGIARAVRADGHRVIAVQTYPADLEREQFPERPPQGVQVGLDMVDGLIVITSAVDGDTLARLQGRGTPLVLVSERADGITAPVVTPDNSGGTRAAVEHLLGHGHRQIGFLGSLRQSDILERYEAYRLTLLEHGIEPQPEWFYGTADNQEASGSAAGRAAMAAGLPTTATLAATDRNAVGFVRALQAKGLLLPRDQALVGFDHSDGGARLRPRLASVDPHHDRVGELAVTVLLAQIRGERVPGQHLSQTTLVTRESCGCLDGCAGAVVSGVPHQPGLSAWQRLGDVAAAVFDGADATLGGGAPALDHWMRGVQRIFRAAAGLGQRPGREALSSLSESTRALRPHPEALEQLVPALRAVEDEFAEQVRRRRDAPPATTGAIPVVPPPGASQATHRPAVPSALVAGGGPVARGPAPGRLKPVAKPPTRPERLRAVARSGTDVLVAVGAGCTQALLARSGQLERTIVDQYELDLELLHADARSIRSLRWLPRGHRGPTTLALWTDVEDGVATESRPGEPQNTNNRRLEIVGTTATSPQARSLVGARLPVAAFPPPALVAEGLGVTFLIPVTFEQSDWGLFMTGGSVDTHATSARDKFDHWAALLAVALDREARLASLRRQQAALAEAAEREKSLALDLRASAERYALVEDVALEGTWDWNIATGEVYYSRTWRALLGLADDEVGTGIEEWTGRVHPDDVRELQVAVAAQLAGATEPLDLEHRMFAADGREVWVRCRATTVTDDAGVRARMVGVLMDMSDAKARERALRGRALADPVTGRVHPELFADRIGRAVERARRESGFDCTALAVDLDVAPSDMLLTAVRAGLSDGDSLSVRGRVLFVLLDGTEPEARARRERGVRAVVGQEACCASVSSLRRYADGALVLRELRTALARERAQTAREPSRDGDAPR